MEDELILSHVAKVRLVALDSRDALLNVIREKGYESAGVEPYLFGAEISSDVLDSHFTHMSESTLTNYAQDAERGVAFLKGHDYRSLPLGYSLTGTLEKGAKQRVVSDFYTVPGSPDTDDLIFRIKTGLLRDVSVGFHGGRMVCDICDSEFWDCRHWPGFKYEEKKGDEVRMILATYTIEDARLSEVSGVFDGSTPDAMILKAQRAAKAGNLSREQVALLEQKYRIALPASRSYAPATTKERKMDEKELEELRTVLGSGSTDGVIARAKEVIAALATAEGRIAALEAQAAEGVEYRNALIEEALSEGVRAQGATFNRALYETTLKSAPLAVVRQMRDDWQRTATAVLPAGRRSSETVDGPKEKKVVNAHPNSAFKS